MRVGLHKIHLLSTRAMSCSPALHRSSPRTKAAPALQRFLSDPVLQSVSSTSGQASLPGRPSSERVQASALHGLVAGMLRLGALVPRSEDPHLNAR